MMKKIKNPESNVDELKSEYRFDYRKAKPNRFAGLPKESLIVVLDSDVVEPSPLRKVVAEDGGGSKRQED